MRPQIFLVDDEQSVLDALQRTLRPHRAAWDVVSFNCPRQAWQQLKTCGADAVVSDLRMPGMDGLQLLARMQQTVQTKDIPFIMLTGQGDRELRRDALENGATDLLNKPADPDELIARIRSSLRLKAAQDELKQYNALLEEKVQQRTRELCHSRLEVVWRLAKAAEFRDEETGNHVIRVASYSRAIAERLQLDPEFVEMLFVTAPLHDIGKIGIPDSILRKPGKLTDAEWITMKHHCAIGARILLDDSKATAVFRSWRGASDETSGAEEPILVMARSIALAHHEKWNGSGYPLGLAGEAIPLEARIVALADVYDALTSIRAYKTAMPHEQAVKTIRDGVGTHFDPRCFRAFEASLAEIQKLRQELADREENEDELELEARA